MAQLSDRHFNLIAEIVEDRAGIRLPRSKRVMLEGRLRKRMRAHGFDELSQYGQHLFDRGGLEHELPDLIDAVTTNKTSFFREPAHFAFLAQEAVPALLQARGPGATHLKLWSTACSNGSEPYTMAMVMAEFAAARPGLHFGVLGTDICQPILAEAAAGTYPDEAIEPVPVELRRRHLLRGRNGSRGLVRIAPELRRQVRFMHLNLMDATYPVDRDFDIAFCRNVLIYFERAVQEAVLARICRHVRPGGYLLLGHSEAMTSVGPEMRQVAPTIFRRERVQHGT